MDSQATAAKLAAGTVEVSGLSHRYGGPADAEILKQVSLRIDSGQILALLGPSGCGKTTLLRALAGLERPHEGRISVDGQDVLGPSAWIPAERRPVGMVFQDWALFPHMNVGANVGYGLGRDQREAAVGAALDLVGLPGLEKRMPNTLSGGQQQRVALARALAPRPDVLLLDEPFSNLDAGLRNELRAEIHRLLVDLGVTAVFVTHDQEEAFILGDEVAVMRDGRIAQVGTPHELYTNPIDRWIATFVGEASIIDGVAEGDKVQTALGPLPLGVDTEGAADVLIRPEQLALVPDGDGLVELIEYHGHDAMVTVAMNQLRVQVRTGPDPGVRRGARAGVAFTGDTVQTFRPGS